VDDLREGEGTRRDDVRPGDGTDAVTLPDLRAPALEVRARIRPDGGPCGLRLRRPGDGEVVVALRLLPDSGTLEVTGRSHPVDLRPGEPPVPARSEVREETTRVPLPGERDRAIEIRLFWDRSLLELFVDGGREVCTRVMATRGEPVEVEAFSEKDPARFDRLEGWPLEEIW
jgi:hypothetical protein